MSDYKVTITESGRCGTVRYAEGWWRRVEFDWEFGGGDIVAMIRIPTAKQWAGAVPWAANRRDEIVRRVADEVRRQRCRDSRVRMTDSWIELVEP